LPRLLVVNAKIALDFHFERAVMIGRHVGSSLPLPDSEVSRRHAQLSPRGTDWIVTDLGSSNGIYVNGKQCDQAVLSEGDEIIVGGSILLFNPPQRAKPYSLLSKHGKALWEKFEAPEDYEPACVTSFSPVELNELVKGWLSHRPQPGKLELPMLVKNETLQCALMLDQHTDRAKLANAILEKIRFRMGGDRLVLHEMHEGKTQMHTLAHWSNTPGEKKLDVPREVLRVCLEFEHAVFCHDVDADFRFRHLTDSPLYRHVQSFVAIPVVGGSHYYGFLYGEAHRGGARYDFEGLMEAWLYLTMFAKALHWYDIASHDIQQNDEERSAAI
jgi:two-component system, NtrC family, sensor kinase